MDELNHRDFAASHGILMNSNGGFYQLGKSYDMDKKVLVVTKYLEQNARLRGSNYLLHRYRLHHRLVSDAEQ